jgi:hypothetical protein
MCRKRYEFLRLTVRFKTVVSWCSSRVNELLTYQYAVRCHSKHGTAAATSSITIVVGSGTTFTPIPELAKTADLLQLARCYQQSRSLEMCGRRCTCSPAEAR